MRSTSLLILDTGQGDSSFNMGLDEALLELGPRLEGPVLRFYGWTEPAASFGYFQRYSEVQRLTALRPLVRRPTGGGIVPHNNDWTYSLVFPPSHAWYTLRAVESYRAVHEWIQTAFSRLGMKTEMAASADKSGPGQCFAGYECFDLLSRGQKIAGAAQRRTKAGLLIQGSIAPSGLPFGRAEWQKATCDSVPPPVGSNRVPFALAKDLIARARELARQKYSQPGYNQRR